VIDHRHLFDATHGALEMKAVGECALPAALGFIRQRVEPTGNVSRRFLGDLLVFDDARTQNAGDGGLLDHLAAIAVMQTQKEVADDARVGDQLAQVVARALAAGMEPEHRFLEPDPDQVILERPVVLEILLDFPCSPYRAAAVRYRGSRGR